MLCLITGLVLLVLGLVPGLFQRFTCDLRHAIEASMGSGPIATRYHTESNHAPAPFWVAGAGALLAVVAVRWLLLTLR